VAPAAPAPPVRAFLNVRGDIWRASNGNWWSLVYATPDGLLVVDPINPDFAAWLKGELARRFPGKPVRYVVYSHSHWDHIEGAAVFADSRPHIVAQAGVARNMDGRYPHMPGGFVDLDNDGAFEIGEVRDRPTHPDYKGVCGSNFFASHDRNHDGKVTPAVFYADVVPPDITFVERMTLRLGGRQVELIYPGKNHADDGTVVYFPAEKVVFSADFPADALVGDTMRSLPSACGMFDYHPLAEWIRSYRSIEALDFDLLVQGHGRVLFGKADVTEGRRFFEDLRDAVSAGMARGESLEELKRSVDLSKYKEWRFYDRLRADDIEAAYLNLKTYR
jgi:glyoxylase-like metal-dependent hydrolase (beta-lactamase superfamily II)